MQKSYERFSSEVLDAASAPVRLQILKLLASKGPLPYTEIMTTNKLDPIRDAGKFVYHLKTLKKAQLVAVEKGTKKYGITELGERLVEFSRDLEEYAAASKGRLFVRTSRMTIEEFDRSKIARSLVTEAGMPQTLASEIAVEAEERLLRFGTTYLTSPLIRELVNTILVERKLEEYRHKLTRLGLPVYDVSMLIREAAQKHLDSGWVQTSAGSAVTGEYVLLQGIDKQLADAHISGRIHLDEADSWILKPSQFFHDLRPVFETGLPGRQAPTTLESALAMVQKLVSIGKGEISGEQIFANFNIFLAPFVKGTTGQQARDAVSIFVHALNWDELSNVLPPRVTIGLARDALSQLQNQPATGPGGKKTGVYGDYTREASDLFRIIIDSAVEISRRTPMVNPSLVVTVSQNRLGEQDAPLTTAFESSAKFSIPNYLIQDPAAPLAVSSEGCIFSNQEYGRGAIVGTVHVNLPRAAYEAAGKDEKFLQTVHDATLDAVKALEVRSRAVTERMREGILPLLSWRPDGTVYYGSSTPVAEIGLLGLSEAVKSHSHNDLGEKQTLALAKRIIETVKRAVHEADVSSLRLTIGLHPSPEASSRLSLIDAEKFGFSTLVYQGSKKNPYYTDAPVVPLAQKMSLSSRGSVEGEFQRMLDGGSLLPLRLGPKVDVANLSRVARDLGEAGVKSFTYSSVRSQCQGCGHSEHGILSRCKSCGSDELTVLGRYSGRPVPMELWPESRRRDLERLTVVDVN
ncbi:hypothetical protein E6H36_00055 [Candidatus Bathyarchaeota archaeon]|nr:MAG: hypothetical protein E6H36_00055 [Candidatus Bathyarchaeota archaeon]TMI31226.1 MAG: hypothetical protein E6H29_05425 [Candidatus Bathyarchaeota archaeon]